MEMTLEDISRLKYAKELLEDPGPVIGAAGGALINSLFMDHFKNMARGHFIIRSLEKKYGIDSVQNNYRELD